MTTRTPALDPLALEEIRALDDDGTLVVEIIELFRSETPGRVTAVCEAFGRDDADGMMREAHALKSSSAQLGAHRLSALCREIEAHGREGRVAESAPLVAEFVEAAKEADAALAVVLESER
ncbi:MAG: Hpt domain-containing protein [Planctomycetota bacterium]|jgi:HPt (histidine-containing phosphotransfer) domain-containing protein